MAFPQGTPPFARTPLTDFASVLGLADIQLGGNEQCKKFEMKYFDCLEAYGIQKGHDKCAPYFEDLYECKHSDKQNARMKRIHQEVVKQVKEGKREYMEPPESDATYGITI